MDAEKQPEKQQKKKPPGRPFKPGQSGNPAGRPPKSKSIPDILERIVNEPVDERGTTRFEKMLRTVHELAEEGTSWAVEFVANRREGKALDRREVDVRNLEPIPFNIVDDDTQE